MIKSLDHLIIAVNNLEEAEQNYQKILGISPSWRGHHKEWGTSNSLFNLQNTYLELLAATGDGVGAQLVKNKIKLKKNNQLISFIFLCNFIVLHVTDA